MSDPILFLQLFWVFFLIGLFTFGGGYAMLSLIQAQVVVSHPWLTESAFTDIVAISQMTPGPVGINCATPQARMPKGNMYQAGPRKSVSCPYS